MTMPTHTTAPFERSSYSPPQERNAARADARPARPPATAGALRPVRRCWPVVPYRHHRAQDRSLPCALQLSLTSEVAPDFP
jgi:hypothetical protein